MATDPNTNAGTVRAAEVVLPCPELDQTLAFFTERLGFRVDAILPADNPAVVVVSGHGLRLRLVRDGQGHPGTLFLSCSDPGAVAGGATELCAPNGTRVLLVDADPAVMVPAGKQSLVVHRLANDARWITGRVGMRYRDLIPDRQGGRFAASHIRVAEGGPVRDYVHYHLVRFQMIYCYKGWVRLVYEDQGPPFVLRAGDCVLQPPRIRHRVLECSPGLEVIEVSCPAVHETRADHDLPLPTAEVLSEREFDGQRFVRHDAAKAPWVPWRMAGFVARDTGIAAATDGLASVQVVRSAGAGTDADADASASAAMPEMRGAATELLFVFVLRGDVTLRCEGRAAEELAEGDCFVIPTGMRHALAARSDDLELLEVTLPDLRSERS